MQTKGRRVIGNKGEAIAEKYLLSKGLDILARNYCIRGGELDLIAKDENGCIVFIEVKFRTTAAFGSGAEAVDSVKQKRMVIAAENYLFENGFTENIGSFCIFKEKKYGRVGITVLKWGSEK